MTELAVRVTALTHRYEEDIPALNGVDLTIGEGAFVAIVGQNGAGKTTLIKHFNGLLRPTSGQVWVCGLDASRARTHELARVVGYVFQNPDHQIFCPTVRDEIGFGLRNLGLGPAEVEERTALALAEYRLEPYAALPPAVLGYGLRRVVCVAAVYAMRPRLLVLDEPTAGLDWRSAREMLERMAALRRAGHTIILVTHDMRLAAEYAEEMVVMHEGRVLLHAPVRQVLQRSEEMARAQLAPPEITQLGQRLAPLGLPRDALTAAELAQACMPLLRRRGSGQSRP